jgi:hypothetical protein
MVKISRRDGGKGVYHALPQTMAVSKRNTKKRNCEIYQRESQWESAANLGH